MPQGLQIFDANGNTLVDITDRFTRVLGVFNTGTTDGSLVDDTLTTGTPWFYAFMLTAAYTFYSRPFELTFNGNTISWKFNGGYNGNQNAALERKIIYGVM